MPRLFKYIEMENEIEGTRTQGEEIGKLFFKGNSSALPDIVFPFSQNVIHTILLD